MRCVDDDLRFEDLPFRTRSPGSVRHDVHGEYAKGPRTSCEGAIGRSTDCESGNFTTQPTERSGKRVHTSRAGHACKLPACTSIRDTACDFRAKSPASRSRLGKTGTSWIFSLKRGRSSPRVSRHKLRLLKRARS